MPRTVYALLAGIDAYKPPVSPLKGCVADIRAIEALLRGALAGSDRRLEALVLLDEQATRASIIQGFVEHLAQAGPDDVALFYYAGHGSQQRTAPEFWYLEPDRLDETLVCYDSREPGRHDLADKELAKLVAGVAARDAHVVVVLDSCHSGSGTRELSSPNVRHAPSPDTVRSLESYLVTPAETAQLRGDPSSAREAGGMLPLPRGRHVLLAACHDNEEAREVRVEGQMRGVFSHCLLESLHNASRMPTYRELIKAVNARVRLQVSGQYPIVEATHGADLDRPFLGGALVDRGHGFTLSFDRQDGWVVDAGALHGIARIDGAETTQFALFDASATQFGDLGQSLGTAEVTAVLPGRSRVALSMRSSSEPETSAIFKAVVTASPLPPLSVALEGAGAEVARLRAALSSSLIVREEPDRAQLAVRVRDDSLRIALTSNGAPVCADLRGVDDAAMRLVVGRLERIARWRSVAALGNPSSKLASDAVIMTVHPDEPTSASASDSLSELRFDYRYRDGEWKPASFTVTLENRSDRRLYCMLLDLTEAFGISSGLIPGGGVWLDPGETAHAYDGRPIEAFIPDNAWKTGVAETRDTLMLLVSTDECDATLLDQPDLDAPDHATRAVREASLGNTLDRLFSRVGTRALGARPPSEGRLPDWITKQIVIATARPLEGTPLSASRTVDVTPQVHVEPHPSLAAVARVATLPAAARSVAMPPLPSLLIDDPSAVRPFDIGAGSRDGDAPLSVLELDVGDASAHLLVTAEAPLRIRIDAPLAEGESVLPLGFDGEFYLPLGRARRVASGVEITLERLPAPLPTRSLTSAIRILFEKIVADVRGKPSRYPLLTQAEPDGRRIEDLEQIAARVKQATRVVVYIHGIIGDTRGMTASGFVPAGSFERPRQALADGYDLVLAFDYENLKTPIEQTARDLKQRLEQVGLGAGHGKTVHLVVHSMGGLVARWFIEREGGHAMVQHLVMLGTPNAGSPWSTLEDFATTAIALGLNAFTAAAWPARILGGLVGAIEYVDVTLDQMRPGSPFLASLAAGEDPRIPYTILAGNTSTILHGVGEDDAQASALRRLLDRLAPSRVMHGVAGLAFFNRPNDIAVSVESIGAIPGGRAIAPVIREVASDHLSYFTTPSVLDALNQLLLPTRPVARS